MIRRSRPPLWLARPSRYATISTINARLLLAGFAALVVLSWAALAFPRAARDGGVDLNANIIDGVRHGGGYYDVAADALRAVGDMLDPFAAIRLPTLALLQAGLPAMMGSVLLFALLAGGAIAWHGRLRPALAKPVALWGATLLFAAGAVAAGRTEAASVHEVWAGLLVALSLARRRPGRWVEALGWGLLAALVRETAALYLVVMLCLAWRDGLRREALGWGVALGVVALTVAAHLLAMGQIAGALSLSDWADSPDPGGAFTAWLEATALDVVPPVLAGPLIALALAGWTAWRDPLATRVVVTLGTFAVLSAMGSPGAGLLTAPVLLIGLAFVPDATRDLLSGALDRRRITVRRVTP